MRNIIKNGDFQGGASLNGAGMVIVGGTPGGGQVNTIVNWPVVPNWLVNGDFTSITSTGSPSYPGASIINTVGILNASVSSIYKSVPPGASTLLVASGADGVTSKLVSGVSSLLTVSQNIVGGARATQGKSCDFSFWYLPTGFGSFRVQVTQTSDLGTITLLDNQIRVSDILGWSVHRRQFSSPLLPPTTAVANITITITLEDGATGKASFPGLNGIRLTGVCLSVPDPAVPGIFSDAERLEEPSELSAGTTSGTSAPSGAVGEFAQTLLPSGSGVSLVTATPKTILSLVLSPGDWDVEGNASFAGTSATVTGLVAGISLTTNVLPTDGSEVYNGDPIVATTVTNGITLPRKRINVTVATTVYLVGQATFSAGTEAGFGQLNARRVR